MVSSFRRENRRDTGSAALTRPARGRRYAACLFALPRSVRGLAGARVYMTAPAPFPPPRRNRWRKPAGCSSLLSLPILSQAPQDRGAVFVRSNGAASGKRRARRRFGCAGRSCAAPPVAQGGFSFYGSLKPFLPFGKTKGRNGVRRAAPLPARYNTGTRSGSRASRTPACPPSGDRGNRPRLPQHSPSSAIQGA